MTIVAYPAGMKFEDWAALLAETFSVVDIPADLPWQEWGERFGDIANVDVPFPENFDTWQEWAERVVESLY